MRLSDVRWLEMCQKYPEAYELRFDYDACVKVWNIQEDKERYRFFCYKEDILFYLLNETGMSWRSVGKFCDKKGLDKNPVLFKEDISNIWSDIAEALMYARGFERFPPDKEDCDIIISALEDCSSILEKLCKDNLFEMIDRTWDFYQTIGVLFSGLDIEPRIQK